MIGGGAEDGIDVRARHQVAKVIVISAPIVRATAPSLGISLLDTMLGAQAMPRIDITHGSDLNLWEAHKAAHVARPLPAHADTAHDDAVAWRRAPIGTAGRGGNEVGGHTRRNRTVQKAAPGEVFASC